MFLVEFLEISLVCCCSTCFYFAIALHFLDYFPCVQFSLLKKFSGGLLDFGLLSNKEPRATFLVRLVPGFMLGLICQEQCFEP